MENTVNNEPIIASEVSTEIVSTPPTTEIPVVQEEVKLEQEQVQTQTQEPDYTTVLKEKTKGRINSFDEIENVLKEYETLKTQPKHEYANDLSRKVDEYLRTHGENADIDSFLRFQKIDTLKLSDFELAKIYYKDVEKLDISEDDLNQWIINTYKIDPDDEIGFSKIEKIDGKLKFDSKKKQMQESIEKWKASFETPTTPTVKNELTKEQVEQQQQEYIAQQIKVQKEADEFFNEFTSVIGEIPKTEKEKVLQDIADLSGQSFWSNFQGKDGFDSKRFYKVALYANNPELVEKQIYDVAYKKATEAILSGVKNPNLTERATSTASVKLTPEEIRKINYERNR